MWRYGGPSIQHFNFIRSATLVIVKTEVRYELGFRPQWEDIEHVRASIAFCLKAVLTNFASHESITMVTAELLENALKYGGTSENIQYVFSLSKNDAFIRVTNPIASVDDANKLIELVTWINEFDEPSLAYQQRMQDIYLSEEIAPGGLGLVRVAYEGECVLSAQYLDGDCIEVVARYRADLSNSDEANSDEDDVVRDPDHDNGS